MVSRFVVHYAEIGTKGANRPVFEEFLERNIRTSLAGLSGLKVRRDHQRVFVLVDDDSATDAKRRLAKVFGVAWYAQVESSSTSHEAILETAVKVLGERARGTSFRVSARRADKTSELSSQALARKLGEGIMERLGLKVDLTHPDSTLYVDVVWGEVLLYCERLKGLGGLPVGVSGRVLHLLSGGIDSPVAGWLMMKRGCRPTYLHFYLAPTAESVLESKIVEIVRELGKYSGGADLILIPFAPYQLATMSLPTDFEPIAFRRFVRLVAERVAPDFACSAISTGDNLAQVASQTLQNLVCIDSGATCPTLRPLITYDKEEIVDLAKQVGTYELSIREYKDCCSIVSRHPRTRMKVAEVDEAASYFRFDALASECIGKGSIITVTPSGAHVRPFPEAMGARAEKVTS